MTDHAAAAGRCLKWHKVAQGLAALVILATCAATSFADGPKPLPEQIVRQWTDVGAEVGWMIATGRGFIQFRAELKGIGGALPAFRFGAWKEGLAAKRADPGSPFGLYLGETQVTDLGLKELTALKSLRSLSLHKTRVTDTGLKELAALRNLQSLELSGTSVTDAGVKELQKALPACRIIR
jgi:internalin A